MHTKLNTVFLNALIRVFCQSNRNVVQAIFILNSVLGTYFCYIMLIFSYELVSWISAADRYTQLSKMVTSDPERIQKMIHLWDSDNLKMISNNTRMCILCDSNPKAIVFIFTLFCLTYWQIIITSNFIELFSAFSPSLFSIGIFFVNFIMPMDSAIDPHGHYPVLSSHDSKVAVFLIALTFLCCPVNSMSCTRPLFSAIGILEVCSLYHIVLVSFFCLIRYDSHLKRKYYILKFILEFIGT